MNYDKPSISVITAAAYADELQLLCDEVNSYGKRNSLVVQLIVVDVFSIFVEQKVLTKNYSFIEFSILRTPPKIQLDAIFYALRYVNADVAITLDPDMYMNVRDFDRFLAAYLDGGELIYGIRRTRRDVPIWRFFASRLYNYVIRHVLRFPVSDINTPLVLISKGLIDTIHNESKPVLVKKALYPYILREKFIEIPVDVSCSKKKSTYSVSSLIFLAFQQLILLAVFSVRLSCGRFRKKVK